MQQDSGSTSMSDDGEPRQRRSGVAMVFKAATPTSPSGRRAPRARWSEEEAQRLAELVSGHSSTVPWGDIAKRLPGRTGKGGARPDGWWALHQCHKVLCAPGVHYQAHNISRAVIASNLWRRQAMPGEVEERSRP